VSPLPAWADTAEGRALLAAIRIEQPDHYVRSNRLPSIYGGHAGTPELRYKGANARAFRKLWDDALEAAMDANDRELFAEINRRRPDAIIEALLSEQTVPYSRVSFDTDPATGNHRFAA
jgi:hypothetical protein